MIISLLRWVADKTTYVVQKSVVFFQGPSQGSLLNYKMLGAALLYDVI